MCVYLHLSLPWNLWVLPGPEWGPNSVDLFSGVHH